MSTDVEIILRQLRDESSHPDSLGLVRLVELLEKEPSRFSPTDTAAIATGLGEVALSSPLPSRYIWAMGKIPKHALKELHSVLLGLPEAMVDEEVIWQAVVAVQNVDALGSAADEPNLRSTEVILAKHHERVSTSPVLSPLGSIRRIQIDRFFAEVAARGES